METKKLPVGTQVKHPQYGKGVVKRIDEYTYAIDFETRGVVDVSRKFGGMELLDEAVEDEEEYGVSELEKAIERVLEKWNGIGEPVELGEKWHGGTLLIQPADPNLKPKEIPVENFFHKIVMLRDRIRVMEQHINSSKKLSDEEKVDLQQYITRIYGSLTTFNVLFKHKEDYFVGSKGK